MAQNESLEEKIGRQPWYRRAVFWLATAGLITGVTGWTLKDGIAALLSGDEPTAIAPSEGWISQEDDGFTGWGPDRPVYTMESPATNAVFNSIIDNESYGDERNFVLVKDATITGSGHWSDDLAVKPGDTVMIRIYYENSAADNFASSQPSWLKDSRARVWTSAQPAFRIGIWTRLSARHVEDVWDGASVFSKEPIHLRPVDSSARLFTNEFPKEGVEVDQVSLLSPAGAQIGNADGNVIPGYAHSGIVTVKFDVIAQN